MRRLLLFPLAFLVVAATGIWERIPLPFTLFTGEGPRKYLPATMPGGIAVFDYDGDGRLDLFFPNGAELPSGRKTKPAHSNRLLRNVPTTTQGKLRFEDRTSETGLAGTGYDTAAAAGDFDGDGRVDLLVCGLRGVTLYRNLPGGTFADVTAKSGIDNHGRWATGAAWLDIDNDGDLDLFIVNYVRWDPASEKECVVAGKPDFCHPRFYDPQPNALFRNNGDGTFTDISESSGIAAHKGKGMAVAVADFDGDGLADIFVTNDRVFNFLFHNLGGGRFSEIALETGVAAPLSGDPPSSMGVSAQDYDNDGKPDLIYTALRDETFPFYRNLGHEFDEVGARTKLDYLTRPMAGWGVTLADLDNDGWKDIAVARSGVLSINGSRGASQPEPVSWLRNEAGLRFSAGSALPAPSAMYRGLVAADFDGDGCLDLVVTALNAPARILRNSCRGNWLNVNVSSAGARVRAGTQWGHVTSATGYASSCACPLHFGLGSQAQIDVEVIWPGGRRKMLPNLKANQTITVTP